MNHIFYARTESYYQIQDEQYYRYNPPIDEVRRQATISDDRLKIDTGDHIIVEFKPEQTEFTIKTPSDICEQ
ncbi:hypothetical protein [Flammeovirga sp. SubArs3]|uniref:hypothetical protein n=1 Tax=Flammeovirga sp. SubArs3 TaxID=2995316 RepID=UPI00248C5FBE|nr:hypothetical protein [Flammeovirga sp. SubArs3]